MNGLSVSVGEFVALLNQTLEFAYPSITITGELVNFKISKSRWIYFDLKDEEATVRFFGTVYQLPGPLEDGMLIAVQGVPRLHPRYGFSVTVQSMQPVGEGSIKKAAALLEAKLKAEGLFEPGRKRSLPYPPTHIGLITSAESAAYRDFIKIINARWGGMEISLIDVQVQGESAPAQLVAAIEQFNQMAEPPEVLVMTRGGGSAEDLQAFNAEQVTRAVAASRIPMLVAIGHEVDISLAELAADRRASTPSNAAELLVPDRETVRADLERQRNQIGQSALHSIKAARGVLTAQADVLYNATLQIAVQTRQLLDLRSRLLVAFNPQSALRRGYALVRKDGYLVQSGGAVKMGDEVEIQLADAILAARVKQVTMKNNG